MKTDGRRVLGISDKCSWLSKQIIGCRVAGARHVIVLNLNRYITGSQCNCLSRGSEIGQHGSLHRSVGKQPPIRIAFRIMWLTLPFSTTRFAWTADMSGSIPLSLSPSFSSRHYIERLKRLSFIVLVQFALSPFIGQSNRSPSGICRQDRGDCKHSVIPGVQTTDPWRPLRQFVRNDNVIVDDVQPNIHILFRTFHG